MSAPDFPDLNEFQRIEFPGPDEANENGIIAAGGNLSPGMLLSAYSQGAFPWYNDEEPILWWNPDPRCVLFPDRLYVSKRMERKLRGGNFTLKSDTAFRDVISMCANIRRKHEDGTWINPDIIESYCRLHELGWAHSVEAWAPAEQGSGAGDDLKLVGGLYGISLGKCFFGESMFSTISDSSKAAFISMVRALHALGVELIDCQISTPHLVSLGAEEVSRREYMEMLDSLLQYPDLRGSWKLFGS